MGFWSRKESDLEREMRYHLEAIADGLERQGMSKEDAMREARREFGGVEQFKEQCRDERRWQPLAQLGQDLTFGWRMLRKTPAVTAAAVLTLALGIGATTAIVSLMDAVLWRTVGVPQAEQLTEVLWQSPKRPEIYRGSSGSMYLQDSVHTADFFSRAAFDEFRTKMSGRMEVAGHFNPDDVSTSYNGVTAVASLRPVSGNFFTMLQAQPALGRLLQMADDDPAAPMTVVVSNYFWRTALHGDPNALGKTMRINNRAYTVAGVLQEQFGGIVTGEPTDLYTTMSHCPAMLEPNGFERRATNDPESWYIQLLARRMPGVTQDALRPEMDAQFRATWARQPKDASATPSIRLQDASTGIGSMRREYGNPFSMLLALVALVLLIACANIANLLLARADTRRKEVALRVSLGCSRSRLVRQFFTESLMLAGFGGLVSLLVAYGTANFAITLMPGNLRLDFDIDGKMILATLAVTALTALVFGLYPAWRAAQLDAAPALKEGAGSVGGTKHGWMAPGKLLVLGQVALGVLLVAAAGVFTVHLRKILISDTGFERTRILMFDLRPGQSGYQDERLRQFYLQLEQRLREVPGVQQAGLARIRPMKGGGYFDGIRLPGHAKPIGTAVNFVTGGYLEALGVPVVEGRGITDQDIRGKVQVAVVSEDIAKEFGRSPVGVVFPMDGKQVEIVGVAARARYGRLTQQQNVIYLPNALSQDSITAVMRTAGPPMSLMGAARKAVADMDANLPVVNPVTMEEQIAATLRRERLFAWLCGSFGVLALVLSMVGLYGVMSYATARRRQEIGIRMALGASPGSVLRHVVGEGVAVVIAGCAAGAPLAWWAAQKYVDYRRLGMDPADPMILIWATTALAVSALVAVLGPALRAASADPMTALREG